ncbi:MAG TPA: HPF/RaiA family ribosome-associated protein [Polyangiaceae bacterium]|jgi:ribosome-associated translation inhibitor RaiA
MDVTVAFVGLEPSDALRAYAIDKMSPLVEVADVMRCRVALEASNRHHAGARFRAKVEVEIPRSTVVVGARGEAYGDPYAAIDAATSDARRVLHERAARTHTLRHR